MELFYSKNIKNGICILDEEEGRHCLKVLRHVPGDTIRVIDGVGNLYECEIAEGKREVTCRVLSVREGFGGHPYHLEMAVAPTKNIDRYEWFLEKGTEIGMDRVVPVIGEHSERKVIKPERCEKILVSAAKQSLKAAVPVLAEQTSVLDFIRQNSDSGGDVASDAAMVLRRRALKLIAFCAEGEKRSLPEELETYLSGVNDLVFGNVRGGRGRGNGMGVPHIKILIGPEGDFSPIEVQAAFAAGFLPIHLGASRLRTETAAVAAVAGVYFGI